jgi:hypothetical protein
MVREVRRESERKGTVYGAENRIEWETGRGMGQETRFKSYSSKLTTKRKKPTNI